MLKWLSLGFLVLHSVVIVLCFRFTRLQPQSGPAYSNLTLVVASEFLKLIASLVLIAFEPRGISSSLRRVFWTELRATSLTGVPGLMYAVVNYLFFVALSNMSVSLYKGTKQLAILFTALIRVVLFRSSIAADKWLSLVVVVGGVVILTARGDNSSTGNLLTGLVCVVAACFLAGLAAVLVEMMLKGDAFTLWERNLQLSLFGVLLGLVAVYSSERDRVASHGFFHGYSAFVWGVAFLQSLGGMLTAVALKYADSILKCVTKAVAVVIGAVCSRLLFREGPALTSFEFLGGMAAIILGSIYYSLDYGTIKRCLCCGEAQSKVAAVTPERVGKSFLGCNYERVAVETHPDTLGPEGASEAEELGDSGGAPETLRGR